MTIGKITIMYGDDALRLAREVLMKQATKTIKPITTTKTMGSLFTKLQGVSGKGSITLDGEALQRALANMEGSTHQQEIFNVLKQMVAKCKNPSVTIGVKSSKQGFNVAGISLRDGERLVASGAASVTTNVTKASVQPQVYKMRLNTADGMISARSFIDVTQPPLITDKIALNLNADDLVTNAYVRVGDTYGAQAHLDVNKLLPYFRSRAEVIKGVKEVNANIAKTYAQTLAKAGLL